MTEDNRTERGFPGSRVSNAGTEALPDFVQTMIFIQNHALQTFIDNINYTLVNNQWVPVDAEHQRRFDILNAAFDLAEESENLWLRNNDDLAYFHFLEEIFGVSLTTSGYQALLSIGRFEEIYTFNDVALNNNVGDVANSFASYVFDNVLLGNIDIEFRTSSPTNFAGDFIYRDAVEIGLGLGIGFISPGSEYAAYYQGMLSRYQGRSFAGFGWSQGGEWLRAHQALYGNFSSGTLFVPASSDLAPEQLFDLSGFGDYDPNSPFALLVNEPNSGLLGAFTFNGARVRYILDRSSLGNLLDPDDGGVLTDLGMVGGLGQAVLGGLRHANIGRAFDQLGAAFDRLNVGPLTDAEFTLRNGVLGYTREDVAIFVENLIEDMADAAALGSEVQATFNGTSVSYHSAMVGVQVALNPFGIEFPNGFTIQVGRVGGGPSNFLVTFSEIGGHGEVRRIYNSITHEYRLYGTREEVNGVIREVLYEEDGVTIRSNHYFTSDGFDLTNFGGQIGDIFGSALGRSLAGDNRLVGFATGFVFGEVGRFIGEGIVYGLFNGDPNVSILDDIENAFTRGLGPDSSTLIQNLQGEAIGAVSSFLVLELADSLGLDGDASAIFGISGTTAVSTVLSNIIDPSKVWNAGFGGFDEFFSGGNYADNVSPGPGTLMVRQIAAYFGQKLGAAIVSPKTQAASFLSSVGSSIGSAIGIMAARNAAWHIANIIAPGIGSLIGFVLGALIGNLFGSSKPKIPTANAETILNFTSGYYETGTVSSQNGGNEDLVQSMSTSARDALNGLISIVASNSKIAGNANLTSPTQIYGHTDNQLWVKLGSASGAKINFDDANAAVEYGSLWAIKNTKISGGDIFAKRAIYYSSSDSVVELLGDIQISEDYNKYQSSSQLINSLFEFSADNLSGADLQFFEDNRLLFEEIASVPFAQLSVAAETFLLSDFDRVQRVQSAASASTAAAGWIITLQRAAELGLNRTSVSDFYGGLGGFVDSLKILSGQEFYNEDVMFGFDGSTMNVDYGRWSADRPEDNLMRGGDLSLGLDLLQSISDPSGGGSQAIEQVDGSSAMVFRDSGFTEWSNGTLYGHQVKLAGGDNEAGHSFKVNGGDYINLGFEAKQLGDANNRLYMYLRFYDAAGVQLAQHSLINGSSTSWTRKTGSYQAGSTAVSARIYMYAYGRTGAGAAVSSVDVAARNFQFNRSSSPFAATPDYRTPVYERFTLDEFYTDGGYNSFNNATRTSASAESKQVLQQAVQALMGGTKSLLSISYSLNSASGSSVTDGNDIHVSTSTTGVTIDDTGSETVTATYEYWDTSNWAEPDFRIGTITQSFSNTGGDDIFVGGSGNDTLYGRGGYDWLSGGEGDDVIYGGSEDDVLLGGAGVDTLFGDAGDDYLAGGAGADNLYGGTGNDTLVAGGNSNWLRGEDGDDTYLIDETTSWRGWVFDGASNNTVNRGNDTVSFERVGWGLSLDLSAPVSAAWAASTWWVQTHADTRQLIATALNSTDADISVGLHKIENLTGTEFADVLTGDAGANVLRGLGGDDTLLGGDGVDTLEGGSGADVLHGEGSWNFASYEHSRSAVWMDLTTREFFGGDAEGDTLTNLAHLIGSDFDDTFFGMTGHNTFYGGRGDDWFVATSGNDQFHGEEDFDTVDYADMTSAVTVNLTTNTGSGAASGHTFYDVEHIVGTDFADNITTDDKDNYLQGGLGNDTLTGGAGLDTYVYNLGDGNDTIVEVEDTGGFDTLVLTGMSWADITLNFPSGDLLVGIADGGTVFVNNNQSNWTVEGTGIDAIDVGGVGSVDIGYLMGGATGGDFADTLYGVAGREDILMGRAGNDVLYAAGTAGGYEVEDNLLWAGRGNDTIYTSVGHDTFIFDKGDGVDTIHDTGGWDRIQFGPDVFADDVIYEVVGDNFIIGVRDIDNPDFTASQVSDRIVIVGGGVEGSASLVEYITAGGVDIDVNKLDISWTQPPPPPPPGGGGGEQPPGGGGYMYPVAFDLNGDGLDLISVNESRVVYGSDSGGPLMRVGWVGAEDGFLALDRDGNGIINRKDEISFVGDFEGATTDLEGLQGFDSNGDGVLDASDARWGEFRIWQDVNQNGVGSAGEQTTLEDAGIVSLDLTLTTTGRDTSNVGDSITLNTAVATLADGTTMVAHDVALRAILARAEGSALPGSDIWSGFDTSTGDGFGVAYTGETFSPDVIASLLNAWDIDAESIEGASWTQLMRHVDLEDVLDAPEAPGINPDDPVTQTFGVKPIVLDLDGDGLELINPAQSPIEFDANGDGALDRIGWVSSDDGLLALDRNGDGAIQVGDEISFVGDLEGAQTDLEGLAAFDSNANGWLDAGDDRFADFRVWVDANYDAVSDVGELRTLDEAGLQRLALTAEADTGISDGVLSNTVFGQSLIDWADGSSGGMAGDVELRAYTGNLEEQMYDAMRRLLAEDRVYGPWDFDRSARRSQMQEFKANEIAEASQAENKTVPLGGYQHGMSSGQSGGPVSGPSIEGINSGSGYDPNGMLAFNSDGFNAPTLAANQGGASQSTAMKSSDVQRWWLAQAGQAPADRMGPGTLGDRLAALDASKQQIAPGGQNRALPEEDAGAIADQQRFLQALAAFNGSSGVATLRKGDQVTRGEYDLFSSRSSLSSTADANKNSLYG